jgi:hypothetical protein
VVPTIGFNLLYVLVIVRLARRELAATLSRNPKQPGFRGARVDGITRETHSPEEISGRRVARYHSEKRGRPRRKPHRRGGCPPPLEMMTQSVDILAQDSLLLPYLAGRSCKAVAPAPRASGTTDLRARSAAVLNFVFSLESQGRRWPQSQR